jgi:hypothetical protein
LVILAILAASLFRTPEGAAAVAASPPREWVNVARPHPAFELIMPELAGQSSDYAILRRTADSARKDVLSWGDAAGNGPYVMVEVYRPGRAGEHFIDAPSEIAARILAFTITDDVKPAGTVGSKFGTVPLVDFAIAAQSSPHARTRRCLGFARPSERPSMQIAGWYCSPGDEVVDRATLACALDRLTVLSAGGDDELARLFAHAEIRRSFCGQRNPILAATPEREVAADIPQSVKLRGRLLQR